MGINRKAYCARTQIILFFLWYELHQTTGKSAAAGLQIALCGTIRKHGTIYARACVFIYPYNKAIQCNSVTITRIKDLLA